jgi:hypothetical protein
MRLARQSDFADFLRLIVRENGPMEGSMMYSKITFVHDVWYFKVS